MTVQDRSASAGDIQETDVAAEEPIHGRLIGGVQCRARRAAAAHDFKPKVQGGEGLAVRRFEMQAQSRRQIE
jgi:hypothetical protein